MSEVTIYHNPRCSKSRQTLELLEANGIEPRVVLYLENPPQAAEVQQILALLKLAPRELMRTGESEYEALDLANPERSDDELIAAMVANPILIERPIVVKGSRAAIGRPPERALEIL
jgi:arsenate reductase